MDHFNVLYESHSVSLADFACDGMSELVGSAHEPTSPLVVFPHTAARIEHSGRRPVLVNANHVVFHEPGRRFRRLLDSDAFYRCSWVRLAPGLERELLAAAAGVLGVGCAASDPRAYMLVRVLAARLRAASVDSLEAEEALYAALALAFGGAVPVRRRRPARERTEREHQALAEDAKAVLAATVTETTSLTRLASRVHTSEFHLARVFRRQTGFTLHGYRTQLRLRLALERIQARHDLSSLAHELGFSSHSHFTRAFRRAFGITPSAARSRAALSELSRIVAAPHAAGA